MNTTQITHDFHFVRLERRLRIDGEAAISRLESTFKSRAKELHRALSARGVQAGLMTVQEALAGALGFPNTHALQQLVKGLTAALPPAEGFVDYRQYEAWVERHRAQMSALVPLFRLTDSFTGFFPLKDDEHALLWSVGASVGERLEVQAEVVRDALAVAWAQASDWGRLADRSPLDGPLTEPVVSFSVEGDPRDAKSVGSFHITDTAHWLWDNLLGSEPHEEAHLSKEDASLAMKTAIGLAQRCPSLFVAWASAATVGHWHHESLGLKWSEVLRYADNAVKAAERLMPKGFKGTISWNDQDNRPYLRCLRTQLDLWLRTKYSWRKAPRLASKLLRLCPDDNLGVRCIHPAILATAHASSASIEKAVRRALNTGGASGMLHAGVAQLMLGDTESGLLHVVESVLRVPEFGAVLLDDPAVRPLVRYRRPMGYEDPFEETLAAVIALDGNEALSAWLQSVLRDAELLAEEGRLDVIAGPRQPEGRPPVRGDWQAWMTEVPLAAQRLTARLLTRYPR